VKVWHEAASKIGTEIELVIVANGLPRETVQGLRTLAETIDNLQVYILQLPCRIPVARFAGLEHAVGDWVVIIDPVSDPPGVLGDLFDAVVRDGADLAAAVDRHPHSGWALSERLLSWCYHRLFRAFHGFNLNQTASSTRLLSRSVVNAILQHDFPLVALDILPLTGGYRSSFVQYSRQVPEKNASTVERILDRWRILLGINAVPLRVANALCALGAGAALVYSVYVALVYFFKEDVVPGWTTLSLLVTGMFLLMSLVLWFLSEYMILLLDAGARRARYDVAEEFASNTQTYRRRLNVESEG
jgi:hypothetical protein